MKKTILCVLVFVFLTGCTIYDYPEETIEDILPEINNKISIKEGNITINRNLSKYLNQMYGNLSVEFMGCIKVRDSAIQSINTIVYGNETEIPSQIIQCDRGSDGVLHSHPQFEDMGLCKFSELDKKRFNGRETHWIDVVMCNRSKFVYVTKDNLKEMFVGVN